MNGDRLAARCRGVRLPCFGIMELAKFGVRTPGFGASAGSCDAAPESQKRFHPSESHFNCMIFIVFFSIAPQ
jgi:hypothetical protein